uniref:Uncharacterized LOC100186174 n=2 Tax=Ciona intestinalis TaxID=7719 RepID=F6WM77_CIOIN|nr:uncharacterized protein LOC100186174 isoform X1 [Ciona intestinalis]|eukprot:XP_002123766.1 uncharacterized protein LOC100186174 isoform X1 [Ciona intestinalis]
MQMAGYFADTARSLYMVTVLHALIAISVCQKLLPFGSKYGDSRLSLEDWSRGYVKVNLTSSINVYGRAMFNELYINTVGAISFGQPVLTHHLDQIQNDVIILAPFLLATEYGDLTFRKLFFREPQSEEEKIEIQRTFRVAIGNSEFLAQRALVVTFIPMYRTNTTQSRELINCFQITLATDGDKTYVRYAYDHLQWIKSEQYYARAGQFVLTGGVLSCSSELPGSGTEEVAGLWAKSNVGVQGNFYWRIDLPLQCSSFGSPCGDINPPPSEANVYRAGNFIGTVYKDQWSFYVFYFCKAGYSTQDNRVSIKIECRYDPDYYQYEWRELSSVEFCTRVTELPSKFLQRIVSTPQVNETTTTVP